MTEHPNPFEEKFYSFLLNTISEEVMKKGECILYEEDVGELDTEALEKLNYSVKRTACYRIGHIWSRKGIFELYESYQYTIKFK